MSASENDADLERFRRELGTKCGAGWWEALESLAREPAFLAFVKREYPSQLERLTDALGRRDFFRLMGASLAVAGFGACTRQPDEKIVPWGSTPERSIPGKPRWFATAMPLGGTALGLIVESHEGRPTKVEGNAEHPASLGATDVFAQAATLSLYDPDRSRALLRAGEIDTWSAFLEELQSQLSALEAVQGDGLAVLAGDVVSPTLAFQLSALRRRFPQMRFHRWLPLHRDGSRAGAQLAFGSDVWVRCDFTRARVVLSLDEDFLASGPGGVRYARDWADGRRTAARDQEMSRLYAVESAPTLTGAAADHRLALRPDAVENLARAVARALDVDVATGTLDERTRRFVDAVVADLRANRGAGLVLAGEGQSPAVHALAHVINARLGNAGKTIEYTLPAEQESAGTAASLRGLVGDMRDDRVRLLVMLGGNPAYDAPADLEFADALRRVPLRVHLSLLEDETSELCHWHVPAAHFLETWSDARAYDGTVSIVQPLIAPLYGGRSAHELVAALAGESGATPHDLVRRRWRDSFEVRTDDDFDRLWKTALHDGLIAATALPALSIAPRDAIDFGAAPAPAEGLVVTFRPDGCVWDGRFANNGWLQETPRPLTRLVWDNAALVGPRTAERLGLATGDVVLVAAGGRSVEAPVWVQPGQADDTVTMHLGYGRRKGGTLGTGVGFDAYRLRTAGAPWTLDGVRVTKTGRRHAFASVQDHARMEGRDLARHAPLERFRTAEHPFAPPLHVDPNLSLYPGFEYAGHAWGMVIDVGACIGCNACMVACQAENNVPLVGKEQVAAGRELHWLRIDRYYEGSDDEPTVLHQPVPCMHCENAPCELVCPVGATVHGDEGLNEMVYNRCVGTRYCSNNCPYKVRRFNFFHYADYQTESLKLGNNPDVTVRSRGVMEKCTYCVQRINEARIGSQLEGRPLRDGDIRTACQAVCPTRAIVFGDINDRSSAVSTDRANPRHYALLEELGTRPRTTYLAKVTNPNAALPPG